MQPPARRCKAKALQGGTKPRINPRRFFERVRVNRLSISRAWDETKARLASDGRLFATVALAMVALPSAVSTLVNPDSGMAQGGSPSAGIVVIVMSLIAMVGQLAIIRLAIGPSVSVGGAIGHSARRAPAYLGSIILIVLGMLVLAVPLIALLAVMGVSFEEGAAAPPAAWVAGLLYVAVLIYVAVRVLMSSSVASAEAAGPITILKRSWNLTRGHGGKLLGFLLLFIVAVLIVLGVISVMTALLARSLLGDLEPFSTAALFAGLVQGIASAAATTVFAVMLARIYVQLDEGGAVPVTVPASGS